MLSRPIVTLFVTASLGLGLSVSAFDLFISDKYMVKSGYHLYQRHCKQCHGEDGKGGSADGLLETVAVPDLTIIAERNDGVFPIWEVYEMISGTELLPAHGTRVMPVWGQELALDLDAKDDSATLVRGRIFTLLAYLETLQTE